MSDKTDREVYLKCPYCTDHDSGHSQRVPKSVGKYRVKVKSGNSLSMTCSRCSRVFVIFNDVKYLWSTMNDREKNSLKADIREDRLHNGERIQNVGRQTVS